MSDDSNKDGWQADMSQALAGMSQTLDGYLHSIGWVRPVRCKDCKYSSPSMEHGFVDCWCDSNRLMGEDGYCSIGEVIGL